MYDNTENAPRRAVAIQAAAGEYDAERALEELKLLADSAGVEIVAEVSQNLSAPDKATYIGSGRLKETALLCESVNADLIIADAELTAAQLRNIEDAADIDVIDRTMLILDIFARSAVTAEGKLQVELSQLKYRLPRLAGAGKALSRLGGGIGTRGPGETKLESDRRHIRRRIEHLEEELETLRRQRDTTRRRRERSGVPLAALAGYTNVGKSSLLNALTGAQVKTEDRLFATLDPTVRKLSPDGAAPFLLADTVGFVSRLPHELVQAFRSTLEEIKYADLILVVCDASDPEWQEHLDVTENTINELGCAEIPRIVVFNKCDLLPKGETRVGLMVSARTGEGLEKLLAAVTEKLEERVVRCRLLIPFKALGAAAKLRDAGAVTVEEYREDGLYLEAAVPRELFGAYREYVLE